MTPKLLVILEQGPTWLRVIEYLVRIASPELPLVLFCFLKPMPPGIEGGEAGEAESDRDRFEAQAEAEAEDLLLAARAVLLRRGLLAAQISFQTAAPSPRLVDEICAAAQRHGCDTIVLARHHKSMVREFFAGDPEERLLRHPTGFTVWLVE